MATGPAGTNVGSQPIQEVIIVGADGTLPPTGNPSVFVQGMAAAGSALAGNPVRVGGSDGSNIRDFGLSLLHTGDQQVVPATTLYAMTVAGFSQLLTPLLQADRQRETGADNVSAIGIATSAQQFLFQGLTTDSTDNFAAASAITVSGATNASPIVLTATAHGMSTGNLVSVASVGGNTAANGTWTISVVNANTFSLNGSTGNGAYSSGGTATAYVTRAFTPVLMTGTFNGVTWTLRQGSVVVIDTGANQETTVVTAVGATTFSAPVINAHNGTVTAFQILVNVFNQERDASGEGPVATGAGAAVALEFEYNGGGPGNQNIDATRNLLGKLWTTASISAGGGAASVSITAGSTPTGLQAGQWIYCTGGAGPNEYVQVRKDYTAASTTIPLNTALVNGHVGGTIGWDAFGNPTAAGLSVVGEGGEAVLLFDPNVTVGNPLFPMQPNQSVTLLASAGRTTTQTSADLNNLNGRFLDVVLDVTTIGTGNITLTINGKDLASGKYYLLLSGAAVSSNSTNVYRVGPSITAVANVAANFEIPRTFQIVVTANNANSVVYSVGYSLGI